MTIDNGQLTIMESLREKRKRNRQIGVCRFPNTFRLYCRGGIHASRVRGTFSPKCSINRNIVLPGGMNASPTVIFQRSQNRPTNTNLSLCFLNIFPRKAEAIRKLSIVNSQFSILNSFSPLPFTFPRNSAML